MKKDTAPVSRKRIYNKQELIFGIVFLLAALLCIFVIFYMIVGMNRRQLEDNSALQEKIEVLNVERVAVTEQARELKARVGTSVYLDKLVDEAQKSYGPDEKNRREGYLWIDRSAQTLYVTLGAVQGLSPGDKLNVFDGETQIGSVRVDTPLDVISYVRPINKDLEDFPRDNYRVKRPEE